MSDEHYEEPPRMRDEPSALGSLFQRAAEDPGLTADAVERVVARAEMTPPTPPTPRAALGPSMLAVLGLLALGGLAAWHFWPAAAATSLSATAIPPAVHPAMPNTPALPPPATLLSPATPTSTETTPTPVPNTSPTVRRALDLRHDLRGQSPRHDLREQSPRHDLRGQSPTAIEPVVAPPPPTEGVLLLRARAALPRDPEGALALAESHRELYPRGTMTSEREVLAIEALQALGRGDAARARGERFLREHATSPYRARVEDVLRHAP